MEIINTQRTITPKVGKPEKRFMCSARHLMVFNICVKFHEIMSRGFRAPDRGRFSVFDAKKMGKNSYSLKPMRQENAH